MLPVRWVMVAVIGCMTTCSGSALAQVSALELYKSRGLLGVFAYDCKALISPDNPYILHHAIDAKRVESAQMDGTSSTTDWQVVWDAGVVLRLSRVRFAGYRDGKPADIIYVVEQGRYQVQELTVGDDAIVVKGWRVKRKGPEGWRHKCP